MRFAVDLLSSPEDVIRMGVSGRLEVGDTLEFHKTCYQLLKDLGNRPLQLDLGGLTYIDSSGIGALVAMHNRAQEEGRHLSITNCNGEIKKVFKLLNLHRLLHLA